MSTHLIIFGRLPDLSIPAKTRLGKEIGDMEKARNIGHFLTENTLHQFETFPAEKYFCYGGMDSVETRCIVSLQEKYSAYTFFPQPQEKDVRGIQEAFSHIFSIDPSAHVVLMGTDIMGLDTNIVQNCFTALREYDACIVPVEDKGYGLVGVSKNIDIISDIKNFESRSEGYDLVQETKDICDKNRYSLFVHPETCFDIDTKDDALRAGLL